MQLIVYFNVALGLFNLIPIPPLDGYNVVLPLLPPRQSFLVQRYAQYGYIALLLLLVLSYGPGNGPLGWLFGLASIDRGGCCSVHRVGQFIGHLTARVDPGEEERARALLPDAAWPLFAAMPTADRRHALDVAGRLARRRAGAIPTCWPPRCCTTRPRASACASGIGSRASCCEAVAPRALARLASTDERFVALPVPPLPAPRGALGRCGRWRPAAARAPRPSSAARPSRPTRRWPQPCGAPTRPLSR